MAYRKLVIGLEGVLEVIVLVIVLVVVATGAICASSGHYWGNSTIYVFSSVHGRAIGERNRAEFDKKEEYWDLREKE